MLDYNKTVVVVSAVKVIIQNQNLPKHYVETLSS